MKYFFIILSVVLLISSTYETPDSTSPTYNIGDIVNGGVVFYIFQSGDKGYVKGETHGLVCAFSDYENKLEWGCFGTDLPSVPNVSYYLSHQEGGGGIPTGLGAEIGDGYSNTNLILNDCPNSPAALAARSLGPDWFLPSINELNQMYINKTTLESTSGFSAFSDEANGWWSSTEDDDEGAWIQHFDDADGYQNYKFKRKTRLVRAVRAF